MLVMYTSLWLADILRVAKRSILLRSSFSESEEKYPACGMFVHSLPGPTRLDYNLGVLLYTPRKQTLHYRTSVNKTPVSQNVL